MTQCPHNLLIISTHPDDIFGRIEVDIQREDKSHVLIDWDIGSLLVPGRDLIGPLWRARILMGLCIKDGQHSETKVKSADIVVYEFQIQ